MLFAWWVATFLVSTSIRNKQNTAYKSRYVATFLVSTSNRNWGIADDTRELLLHFLFLHQTATRTSCRKFIHRLLHFLFLHQTATSFHNNYINPRCYISCFYIKPQRSTCASCCSKVATFLVSTSNRNSDDVVSFVNSVATFLVSTSNRNLSFNPKNQWSVATFLVSTSNRNLPVFHLALHYVATFLVSTSNRN